MTKGKKNQKPEKPKNPEANREEIVPRPENNPPVSAEEGKLFHRGRTLLQRTEHAAEIRAISLAEGIERGRPTLDKCAALLTAKADFYTAQENMRRYDEVGRREGFTFRMPPEIEQTARGHEQDRLLGFESKIEKAQTACEPIPHS